MGMKSLFFLMITVIGARQRQHQLFLSDVLLTVSVEHNFKEQLLLGPIFVGTRRAFTKKTLIWFGTSVESVPQGF